MFPVHRGEPLPAFERQEHVHRPQSHQPFRSPGHAVLPQVRPEEAQLRKLNESSRARGRGRVAQSVDRPSKVLVWCSSVVSSIPGHGI